jgi:DNA-binding MarR family transcriptional regulator
VKELESEGLARRRADAKDGRRNYVSLSPKGRRLFEEIHKRTHELEQSLSSVLGADEMRGAAIILSRLRTFIESRGAATQPPGKRSPRGFLHGIRRERGL